MLQQHGCLCVCLQRFKIIDKLLYMYQNSFQNTFNSMLMRKFYFECFHLVHRHRQKGVDIYRHVLNRQHCVAGKFIFCLTVAVIFKIPTTAACFCSPKISFFSGFLAAIACLKDPVICAAFNKTRSHMDFDTLGQKSFTCLQLD